MKRLETNVTSDELSLPGVQENLRTVGLDESTTSSSANNQTILSKFMWGLPSSRGTYTRTINGKASLAVAGRVNGSVASIADNITNIVTTEDIIVESNNPYVANDPYFASRTRFPDMSSSTDEDIMAAMKVSTRNTTENTFLRLIDYVGSTITSTFGGSSDMTPALDRGNSNLSSTDSVLWIINPFMNTSAGKLGEQTDSRNADVAMFNSYTADTAYVFRRSEHRINMALTFNETAMPFYDSVDNFVPASKDLCWETMVGQVCTKMRLTHCHKFSR